jgi:regulator of cell morphogenesis and NO signaling
METDILKANSVGEIVALDFRTAAVFKSNRIDFCCGGKKTLKKPARNFK